jgi:hypothetical protein
MSEVKIVFKCDGCGATVSFLSSEAGTVQDCPECGGWLDVPEITRTEGQKDGPPWRNLQEELNARYFEESVRQQGENARLFEVAREHQQLDRENIDHATAILGRQEELLDHVARIAKRYEEMASRIETLLSRWEKTT